MKRKANRKTRATIVLLATLVWVMSAQSSWAVGNIDADNSEAWSENAGWINFAPSDGGVTVSETALAGFAWSENIGWIKFGSGTPPYVNTDVDNWGVNLVKGSGSLFTLTGYAWSENGGWIRFDPTHHGVTINGSTGVFGGYAWAENIGWIHLRGEAPVYGVVTTAGLIPNGTVLVVR